MLVLVTVNVALTSGWPEETRKGELLFHLAVTVNVVNVVRKAAISMMANGTAIKRWDL